MRFLPLTSLLVIATQVTGCGGTRSASPPVAGSTFGVVWTPVSPEPALAPRACPAHDCLGVSDPGLIRMSDGRLIMLYTAGGSSGGPLIARCRLDAVPSATREPDAPVVSPVVGGIWDRFVETVSLQPDSATGRMRMAYLGYADTGFVQPAIGLMTSTDRAGTQWTRPTAPIYRPTPGAWDAAFITGPSLMRAPDGAWRCYYAGAGTTVGIGLLTSPDGVTWTPYASAPVFERRPGEWDEAVLEPCVRYLGGRWYLWYSGYREPLGDATRIGIGLAISDDGIHWSRVGNGPVLAPAAGRWYSLRVLSPDVIQEPDGGLLMAAYGMASSDIGVNLGTIGFWRSR